MRIAQRKDEEIMRNACGGILGDLNWAQWVMFAGQVTHYRPPDGLSGSGGRFCLQTAALPVASRRTTMMRSRPMEPGGE
jgi:hypothetical protein